MNDTKRERIAALVIVALQKKLRVDQLAMRNTSGLDAESRENLQIEYSIAQAEYYEAKKNLDDVVLP